MPNLAAPPCFLAAALAATIFAVTSVSAQKAPMTNAPGPSQSKENLPQASPDQSASELSKPSDYRKRAQELRAAGDIKGALQMAKDVVAAFPDRSSAYAEAGILYAWLHHRVEAIAAYDHAIAIKPEDYLYLNRSLTRPKQDIAARRADINLALALNPTFGAALAEKARLTLASGDAVGAIADFTVAIAAFPEDESLFVERGIARAKASEQDFAAAKARQVDASALDASCRLKTNAGIKLEEALAECTAAIAMAPRSANSIAARGFALLRLGRVDESLRDFDRTLQLDAEHPGALFGRAIAFKRNGDKVRSDGALAAALKADADVQRDFAYWGFAL